MGKARATERAGESAGSLQPRGRARLGIAASMAIVAVVLAAGVALLISGVKDQLPVIAGLDYRVLQVGLVVLVLAFAFYTYEREKHVRNIGDALTDQRIESARLGARLDFLADVQTERDTVAALLLASADGILVVDKDRRVNRMNPTLQEISGWSDFRAAGKTCEEVFSCKHEGELRCGACPFTKVLASGEPLRDHSFETVRPDGATIWISGAYAPVRDLEGNIALAIGSLRDVTRTKEVEQLQNDFVSIVSHELRGPLTAIKGFVKTLILKSDVLPQETREEFLGTINDQADRLNQLVEDLLNVSRIESRRLKMRMVDNDAAHLVEKLVSQFRAKWGDREILIDADPSLPPLFGDTSKLEEIFINLIDNALKYSPSGGLVRINMWPTKDSVEISIEDSGIGMAAEDLKTLFQKFHRVSSVETREIGGTGLGLYIVKNLVEAHGGRVFVTSVRGVGTTFTLSFPAGEGLEQQDR
ncbi:MAG: ATP-binding protein [Actinomycetota bacterium]|nr:PAS domain-containing sensor histidine kinase [Actinomycetota bacterium]